MIETFRHDGNDCREAALYFVGDREGQQKVLPARPRVFSARKDGAEIVARMAEAARGHIAVEKIDVANETGVVESGLINRSCATADESTASPGPVFLKLIPERTKWHTQQRGDCAANTVKYVSLQQCAGLSSQMRELRVARECRYPLDRRGLSFGVLRAHPFLLSLVPSVMV